jgi:hypothetical protein
MTAREHQVELGAAGRVLIAHVIQLLVLQILEAEVAQEAE